MQGVPDPEELQRAMQSRFVTYTVGNKTFQSRTLNAVDQFHCARRIAPIAKALGPILISMAERKGDESSGGIEGMVGLFSGVDTSEIFDTLGPIADALAAMSDADANYVIGKSLSVTQQRNGAGGWQDLVVRVNGNHSLGDTLMDIGLNLNHVLRICYEVLKHSLARAFPDVIASIEAMAASQAAAGPGEARI